MRVNVSPEEKLLNLIKGKKTHSMPPDLSVVSAKEPVLKKHNASVWVQRVVGLWNPRRVIYSMCIMAGVFAIVPFAHPLLNRRADVLVLEKKIIAPFPAALKQETKPYEFYLEGVKNHAIFGPATSVNTESAASISATDIMKDINLVGIISGDNPQAVLEDTKAQKTYYLSKGQSIGQVQVDDITQGKIILKYNGQKYELYL